MLKGRAENWEGDWGSGILAFRIVLCTTKTTRIQEWVSDTHAYNYVLAYIAIGSRRNMLLVVTLAKTRCKFCTRKLSPKIEDKKLHFDKEKTLVPYQFPPFSGVH